MTTPNDKHDLSWRAFRYISDEMTAEEAAAFEELLAVDQRAREETARSVELAHAIVAAPPVERKLRDWSLRLAWALVGTAACVTALVSYQLWKAHEGNRFVATGGASPAWFNEQGAGGLAAAWVDSQSAVGDAAGEEAEAVEEVAESILPAVAMNETDSEPEALVPGWLLAALSAQPEMPKAESSSPESTPGGSNERLEN